MSLFTQLKIFFAKPPKNDLKNKNRRASLNSRKVENNRSIIMNFHIVIVTLTRQMETKHTSELNEIQDLSFFQFVLLIVVKTAYDTWSHCDSNSCFFATSSQFYSGISGHCLKSQLPAAPSCFQLPVSSFQFPIFIFQLGEDEMRCT